MLSYFDFPDFNLHPHLLIFQHPSLKKSAVSNAFSAMSDLREPCVLAQPLPMKGFGEKFSPPPQVDAELLRQLTAPCPHVLQQFHDPEVVCVL